MTRIPRSALLALAAALMALPVGAQTSISTDGAIESKSGGFRFPDGSVQQVAAVPLGDCPTMDPSDEMIWVGGVCIDKYEASIWDAPVGGDQITNDMLIPCSPNGQDCVGVIYARSVADVEPRTDITWFQAQAALANSGKRLPTNAEWQMAVRGTPDPGDSPGPEDCNTSSSDPEVTGVRANCVSAWGSFDMVGNLSEWVADWAPFSTVCPSWGGFSDDEMCLSGASTTEEGPGALIRGGDWTDGTGAGAFAVRGDFRPSSQFSKIGFRGAR